MSRRDGGRASDLYASRRYGVERMASGSAYIRASAEDFRRLLRPGSADVVAQMILFDLDSIDMRLERLRELLAREAAA